MSIGQVIINEMNLNIPGVNQVEANLIGQDVIKRINDMLGDTDIPERVIDSMAIKVEIPQRMPKERLAVMIAKQICKRLI
jgi:hypothetical protein